MFERFFNKIDSARDNFIAKDNSDRIWLLRRGVYFTTFFYFLLLLPEADYFYGPDSLVYGYPRFFDWFEPGVRLLFTNTFGPYYLYFFFGLFISIAIGIWKPFVRISGPFIYFFAFNLFNRSEYISNGSVTVSCLLLIYLILMSEDRNSFKNEKFEYTNKLLTNATFLIAQLQICTVYLTAGLYKLSGEQWLNGSAFYYTLNFEYLSHKLIANQFFKSDFLLYASNYCALAYQVFFSFLVWIKPIKKWLLLAGFMLHIGIIVINGLVDFGLIMMVSYSLFIDNETAGNVRSFFNSIFKRNGFIFKKLNSGN
ncbi:MAG: HTTM domain-containing protein [Flavobacteriales bacterium]|nr:HTTM domain-containing protein [Flavobacteriales bacterium]